MKKPGDARRCHSQMTGSMRQPFLNVASAVLEVRELVVRLETLSFSVANEEMSSG